MPKVFISHAQGGERLIFGPRQPPVGGARGWQQLAALYAASLEGCGYRAINVLRPEIYQTAAAREVLGVEPADWHLAVKPSEHLRPFHGVPNVFVCNCPFPQRPTTMPGGSALSDPVRLLQMADVVLCCTPFIADTLRSAGINRVLTLPPAILRPQGQRPDGRAPGLQFLCAQPGPPSIVTQGFAQAAAQRPDLQLVLYEQKDEPAADAAAELDRLLGETDFFLSAAPAAGLDLPLVRAMLAGVPLVTPLHSGMTGLLPREAAMAIETRPGTLGDTTAHTVRDAVLAAAELDGLGRARMAAGARDSAERRFGPAAFAAGLTELHHMLASRAP